MTIGKLSALLGADQAEIAVMVKERKLDAAILASLKRRGTVVTPALKNSVRTLVKQIEPTEPAPQSAAQMTAPLISESTATIMFTDIVGSTDLMVRLGDRRGRRLFAAHDQIVRAAAAELGGTEVKSTGDGMMLAFHSARRAVSCAMAVQNAIADLGETSAGPSIGVRIGLSVGEPVEDRQDLFGISVNLAARITEEAQGGQILASRMVCDLASTSHDFEFNLIGSLKLKGIEEQQTVYEVLWRP